MERLSSQTTAPPHAPGCYGPGPSEALTGAKEQLTGLTNLDEEKASDSDEVDDEDLVSFHEFSFASHGDSLVFLASHEKLCLLKAT